MLFNIFFFDAPEAGQLGLQESAAKFMYGLIKFHNDLLIYMGIIAIVVFYLLYNVYKNWQETSNFIIGTPFTHSTILEIIWTLVPAFILVLIATPSFALLYAMDELFWAELTIKVIGHQWYWSYEYSDFVDINDKPFMFDSYMVPTNDLVFGTFRLLEVDNRLIVPVGDYIRFLITSADVLHSWAIPSLGIKVDACPGRLVQTTSLITRTGTYYGQCSEICGINHGFMPIVVRAVFYKIFLEWLIVKFNIEE